MTSFFQDLLKRFAKDDNSDPTDPDSSIEAVAHSLLPPGALVRGVHFFSAHDPISFLDAFRPERVDDEMRAIRDDGFSHLILLLPWHALFPEPERAALDPWYAERVVLLLQAAQRQRLKVLGRIFFAHSPNPCRDEILHKRHYAMLEHPAGAAEALGAQARLLAQLVQRQLAWAGAFMTWEDFRPCFDGPPRLDLHQRIALARSSGFSRWIDEYRMAEAAEQAELMQQDQVWPIPMHQQEAMRLWVSFFDHLLRERVLKPCLPAFPELGIEVRADAYPIARADEGQDWVLFDNFKDWRGQRCLYWAPSYGMPNQGERVNANTAIQGLTALLEQQASERRPLLEQFNFRDETLQFAEHNARILDADLSDFLARSAAVLERHSAGYALWAYRDYRENLIENASFQRLSPAWNGQVPDLDEAGVAVLAPLAKLRQIFSPEMHAQAAQTAYRRFRCEIETDCPTLEIQLGASPIQGQPLRAGWLQFDVPIEDLGWQCSELCIHNPGLVTARLRTVYLYGFVQRLKVRNRFGEPGPHLESIQLLNRALSVAG